MNRPIYEALLSSRSQLGDIGRISLKPPHRDALRARLAEWESIVLVEPS